MKISTRALFLLPTLAFWGAVSLASPQRGLTPATDIGRHVTRVPILVDSTAFPTCFLRAARGNRLRVVQDPSAAAVPVQIEMLRFRDGSIQWGSITDHTAETVTFTRLDTGGLVTMPWGFLDPKQEYDLRLGFGYVEVGAEEIMVPAEMLITPEGQEIVGVILGRTEDAIQIKSGGLTIKVPKNRVRSHVAGLMVPALDIYTKDELYTRELQKADQTDPQAQLDLAEFCERILDFPRALQHYQKAVELDPEFKAEELEVILERVKVKVEHLEQIEALAEIDHLNRRKKYEEALQALVLFDSSYPGSPLVTDRLKLEQRVLKARGELLRREVPKWWFTWMSKLAGDAARDMTFDQTLSYIEEGLGQEVVNKVTEKMREVWPEIEEDHVRQLFAERKRGRWKPASYGLGTWLLGEEDALKGQEAQEAPKEPASPRDQERQKIEEQIKRFVRNQEISKRTRKSEEDEEEVETAWKLLPSSSRRNWIIAFYAENGGDLDVLPKPDLRNCSECGGTGTRDVVFTGGPREDSSSGRALLPCPTCHGLGRVRRVRYR